MQIKEIVTEAMAEKRIRTGVRNTTILDPSTYTGGWYAQNYFKKKGVKIRHYSGDPMGYTLSNVQERHFENLSDILARSGLKFDYLGVAEYEGEPSYMNRKPKGPGPTLFRFAMTAPGFVWEKYEGVSAGGGRNTVYVNGEAMKLTHFNSLSPAKQDKLIQASQI